MALEQYIRKRSFDHTPEPKPRQRQPAGKDNRFCVQRHDATRLHYDFRLEVGGALKSWAVPKGPSLDPADKRMAVQVEDHPIEYGDFEGNIPKGNYGAGSVMLWDRGTYELLGEKPAQEQLDRGDFKFRLHGEKLQGEFALVRMKGRGKGNEWLLIKKKDDKAQPGWDIESFAWSVLSGRTQEEIAKGFEAPAGKQPKEWREGRAKPAAAAARATPVKVDPSTLTGAIRAEMPSKVAPMLASVAEQLPRSGNWLYEIKWDGVRSICYLDGQKVRLVSRTGHAMERQYPELSVLHHYVSAKTAILDGEIVILDQRGLPSFALLQTRITVGDANAIAHLARSRPVVLYVFDLLYLDGYDLRQSPLSERKQLLQKILNPSPILKYSQHFEADGQQLLEAVREQGLEGVIAKRAESCYESKRSREWLKVKVVSQQEFVICGYTTGERDYFSSLVLGLYQDGRLVYAGNVGAGFDQKCLEDVFRIIEPLTTTRSPFRDNPKMLRKPIWVRPEVVCEVRFASWTEDGRLRAPVFLGLRTDIDPRECVRESPAKSIDEPPASSKPTPLLSGKAEEAQVVIDGRRLKFTNLNKIFYPKENHTKRDILNYYDGVAELLVPYLKDRPLSLKRYPNGIEGEYFFQKNTPENYPSWLRVESIYSEHNDGPIRYIIGKDRATLLYLVNLGCIDHNPWMSRVGSLEHPDFILIDLDPQDAEFQLVVEAAQLIRRKLDAIELEGYPKTTGGKGMHIYVPVEPIYTYEQTRTFAEILAHLVATERPEMFTTPRPVARRQKGRIYFDYLQNGESKTIAAPYVLRAYPGAPVATPLAWREVTSSLLPTQFHIGNALERFERVGDLFSPVLTNLQRLEQPLARLSELVHRTERTR